MAEIDSSIFKAYDVRGVFPTQINEEIAYKVAQAYVELFKPKTVVLGKDVRLSGPTMWEAAKNGFIDAGVNVIDIGVISTDMLYFAAANYECDGGMSITASHNPKEYSGIKMVKKGAIPISGDSGIYTIRDYVIAGKSIKKFIKGRVTRLNLLDEYCTKILSFLKPLKKHYKIVANANFGVSGLVLQKLIEKGNLPIELVAKIDFTPDGNFPKGAPNPMLEDRRTETISTVKELHPDFGIAWDADADRVFFYDEAGNAIESYFITAILSQYFLHEVEFAKILCDTRLIYAIQAMCDANHGTLIINKAGHSFIKETMRKDDVIFGGEMSGHYYFKDFFYADNGMIPLMIMLNLLENVTKLSDLSNPLTEKYFISNEKNIEVASAEKVISFIKNKYHNFANINYIDGITFEYENWRFNLRSSNTEPLIRLNVESLDKELMERMTREILQDITDHKND